mmetsp:Transcript_10922/g.16369  ORF Transcript_10922/g.16369 Transcript_10922/m.16369 type:complete len:464 (+) Transcript_10922:550-1941(+)
MLNNNPDVLYMNVNSDLQKRQLFFAPCANQKNPDQVLEETREFKIDNVEGFLEPGATKPKKTRVIQIHGLNLKPIDYTTSGWPAASGSVLRKLAGSPIVEKKNNKEVVVGYDGAAFEAFGGGTRGKKACEAINNLVEVGAISQLLDTFIIPLQHRCDEASRVHTSMNINTETGRLSCRSPNLQNQPALEKDRYHIRGAFCAKPKHKLIVADYGQLELRLLAHMTQCHSMIEAFRKGGDFHSRTALGMYPEVSNAVESGDVLLEWDYAAANGAEPDKPLLKDVYATERKRAKTLNFSIAYGKTAMGLAKDWAVSVKEAKRTLDLWFEDRPEVRAWQQRTIAEAKRTGYTRTLMGRYRLLPDINSRNRGFRSHSERAAINTPLQGGAADVVMMAMLKVHHDERLQTLGWKQLLQIHDELILEGPQESCEEALQRLKDIMAHPFEQPLLIDLVVDASIGDTWLEAK